MTNATAADRSAGHLCFLGNTEFFHAEDGTLYSAPKSAPLDLGGYRQGARFECMPRSDRHIRYMNLCYCAGLDEDAAQ